MEQELQDKINRWCRAKLAERACSNKQIQEALADPDTFFNIEEEYVRGYSSTYTLDPDQYLLQIRYRMPNGTGGLVDVQDLLYQSLNIREFLIEIFNS